MGLRVSWCSPRRHHAVIINRGNLLFLISSLINLIFSPVGSYLSYYFVHFKTYFFLYFQGLNLLELTAHFKGKAAQLRCKGLGQIKIVLAGTDTSSLLEILKGHFGHVDLDTSKSTISTEKSEKEVTIEEKPSDIPEKATTTLSNIGGLTTAELVFHLKSIPLLLLASLNHIYHFMVLRPSLNIHTLKHVKENFPIHPNHPAFSQQFACASGHEATPSTSKPQLNFPPVDVICKWAEATKQFLEGDPEGGQPTFHCSSTEGFESSHHEVAIPKCCIKQGPVKSSKKCMEPTEVQTKDEDE